MKTTRNLLFALLLLGGTAGAARASTSVSAGIHIGPSGHTSVDLGFFYDDLAPYGNWIERPSYGWVWTPRQVSTSWRPYRDGHWVWTDEGWTWISDEPYGWATYHYGRWYDDPEIGWAWVPDDEWAPSWVSFQEGADYVGWAPLPPGVSVSVSVGSGYGGYAYGIAPEYYQFVPVRGGMVLASAARMGLARTYEGQDLVTFERFFAGGANSVRGYRQDDLGPRSILGDAAGGSALLVFNEELRFPVYKWLRGVGFVDLGNVYDTVGDISLGDLQVGVGAGVRLDTPVGLFRVDLGVPANPRSFDPKWKIYFGLGHAF